MTTQQPPEETSVALPAARAFAVAPNITVQPPLTRRGHGPALVLLVDDALPLQAAQDKTLDPPPLQKWAEEGYAVAQITLAAADDQNGIKRDFASAVSAFEKLGECDQKDKFGVITYTPISKAMLELLDASPSVTAIVNYSNQPVTGDTPTLWHAPSDAAAQPPTATSTSSTTHHYPSAPSHFALPAHPSYHPPSAAVAHTRTLTFLKPLVGGPYFDLEAIWDEHCRFEFAERAVAKTMGTMVQEPYVNHIPTITGGIGRERLTAFYCNHFVHSNPADTSLELVSRTVGVDRVIDEFNFKCTHDRVVDWLVPGVPPTGKPLAVPFTSIVNIRGDRLFHEHIAWDQATLLRQLGLLPEYLPFPYPVDGKGPAPGKRFEYRVPVAGAETAAKLLDENSVESNQMFKFGIREVDDN